MDGYRERHRARKPTRYGPGRIPPAPRRDAASALGCEVEAITSSLLFLADDEPVLVMTSGRHRVDTDYLARQLGAVTDGTPLRVAED
ncbi:hypothetical protein KXR78_08705 [Microbacterium barkeri]